MSEARLSKPARAHNHLMAPGVCLCVECCRIVLDLRCDKWTTFPDAEGGSLRCGDYKGHRGHHTILVSTSFVIVEERVRLDSPRPLNQGGETPNE
jgi:hypothetical protein